ncbi:2-polyprenyl-6-methoxyphenol hydroxylase-like oxidoreductase [Aureobasidium pullulans]|uniref:2-polyprenyl-6-methoxyphenol hydroxylase-like oxidoreductase n=1 Tax=Aureobasidium pullulans TaxID=5580 RepID=A0A4S9ZDB1_AURPU|nr:2-polyprenyl-6-methoxyphenol hydroxylase-like oxidoreductase [Aureobasidium pullulans]TIA03494.1 2-polyprenyl-6-methoxyphenol hydroxylase-like oxidoreductase [Aureobasidium pullulans]
MQSSTDAQPKPVLIVGAGPTGLCLALWLNRLGISFRIIDQASGPGTTSRAIICHARTLEMYQSLGIAEDMISHGSKLQNVTIAQQGQIRGSLKFGNIGTGLSPFPFILSLPQDIHERVLLDHLQRAGITIERSTTLESLKQHDDGVTARVCGPHSDHEDVSASYVAGCDGARSTVRKSCGIKFEGGTYEQKFFVSDVNATGHIPTGDVNIFASGRNFCIAIPLPGEKRYRVLGLVPEGVKDGDLEFSDVQPAVEDNTRLGITAVNWFSTYSVHHRVASQFRDRNVFLLGDAAHVHSPVGGQGMNTGLGDAANLAWKLASCLKGTTDPKILDTYHQERAALATELVNSTDRICTLVQARSLLGTVARSFMLPYVLPIAFKLPWIPTFAFKKNSQIQISYPQSDLSTGNGAGCRLPWVETGESDNYKSLEDSRWVMHVYGEASDEVATLASESYIPLHRYAWSDHVSKAGLVRDSVYLVRPDGYVGYLGTDPGELGDYLKRWTVPEQK